MLGGVPMPAMLGDAGLAGPAPPPPLPELWLWKLSTERFAPRTSNEPGICTWRPWRALDVVCRIA